MELARRKDHYKIERYFLDDGPLRRDLYAKHVDFFAAGATYKERLFMAANRVGKSDAGAFEVTCHVTASIRRGGLGVAQHATSFKKSWLAGLTPSALGCCPGI